MKTQALQKCPNCEYAKVLCETHGVCRECDRGCYPIAKTRKVKCVGSCGAKLTWQHGQELKCKTCGMVYRESTRVRDGWRDVHMPVNFQEIRRLEAELERLKAAKRQTTKIKEEAFTLAETIDSRRERADWIDVIVSPDGTEYLINYAVPSTGSMRADITVWPALEKEPVAYLTECAKFGEGSSDTRRMMMASKKSSRKSSGNGRGRTSEVAGLKVYKAVSENPYREGSHIAKTFAKITNGMSVEKVKELTAGKAIEFHTMYNHGTIVVTESKTKPTPSTISRLRAKQAHGVTGEGRDLSRSRQSAPKAKKKATKKAKAKAKKKAAKRKTAKKSKSKRKARKKSTAGSSATSADTSVF